MNKEKKQFTIKCDKENGMVIEKRNSNQALKFMIYLFIYKLLEYTSLIATQNSGGNRDLTIMSLSFIMIRHILSIYIFRQHNSYKEADKKQKYLPLCYHRYQILQGP